ncbi:MAG: hypothetical protein IJT45_09325 [Bacteroidales bacterium]|nr:hypothetical protein [Bacteroidales bacterium]
MSKYTIHEVTTKYEIKQWLAFPAKLYRHDPHYVRPLDREVEHVFNHEDNKLFRHGDATRYYLTNERGKIVGRIAVFYDEKTSKVYENEENGQKTGGCGFFDCIDDQEAANTLFDAAKKWLEERGYEAMDGPINFGDRDYFWGCLAEGFTDPIYNMPYNYPYYNQLFENYGFKDYFKQLTFRRSLTPGGFDPILHEKAHRIYENPNYSFEILDRRKIDRYADDFLTIYNKSWGSIPGTAKLTRQHAVALLKSLKPIIDPRLMHFAYYKGEPVGFFLMMIDLNQIYKGLNGNDKGFNALRVFWRVKIARICDRAISLVFGIVPEHRKRGLESGLVCSLEAQAIKRKFKYKELQINWIGDFNPPMLKIVEHAGAEHYKTHITYRYLFDRNKPFTRAKLQYNGKKED